MASGSRWLSQPADRVFENSEECGTPSVERSGSRLYTHDTHQEHHIDVRSWLVDVELQELMTAKARPEKEIPRLSLCAVGNAAELGLG